MSNWISRVSQASIALCTAWIVPALLASNATAQATVFEIEPNETKAQATANGVVVITAGDILTGTTTGTSTVTPGGASADTWRIQTAPLPLGIYRHTLTLTTGGTAGHTGTIRGLNQTSGPGLPGTVGTTDVTFQTSSTTTNRSVSWYGFGRGEQLYYRVTGTATTLASYQATLNTAPVAVFGGGTFLAGNIRFSTVGQTSVDTDIHLFDGSLTIIDDASNDDESVAEGGTGAALQSQLNRVLPGGTAYLAVGRFNTATDDNSPATDDFRTGNVLDFPDAIACSSTTTAAGGTDYDLLVTDGNGPVAVPVLGPSNEPYSIAFVQFLIAGAPDADGDGVPDGSDNCPTVPNPTQADLDGDGAGDACDTCTDTDGDGFGNPGFPANTCPVDGCPNDPLKSAPGQCGCGIADTDTDGDGTADCNDGCPADPLKTSPGQCGCGVADTDSDGDGTADCNDGCPSDPLKTAPGTCGCGVLDIDTNGDLAPDCNDDCAAPMVLVGQGTFPFINAAASTGAQGQNASLCNLGGGPAIERDLWYSWTALSSGTATISTCGSTAVNTKLAVYHGTGCPLLAPIACNDDACGQQSQVSFAAVAGNQYTLQLGSAIGTAGGSGSFAISVTLAPSAFAAGLEASGTSAGAYTLAVFNDGIATRLYAAGEFEAAGAASAGRIASWNGTSWTSLGLGVNGSAAAMAVFDEDAGGPQPPRLFVGGAFTQAGGAPASNVARWDGANWTPVGTGTDDWVSTLLVFDADGPGPAAPALYAGGLFRQAGGAPANFIARWNGAAWQPLSTGFDGPVTCLAAYDADGAGPAPAQLHAGGYFRNAGATPVNGLARWDGASWQPVGGGVSGSQSRPAVHALTQFDEDGGGPLPPRLFAGGSFTSAGGVPVNSMARWDGANFSAVGGGFTASGSFPTVRALAVINEGAGERLFAAGLFRTAGGVSVAVDALNPTPLLIAARWDGVAWTALGAGLDANADSIGRSIVHFDDDGNGTPSVLIAGHFASIGSGAASGVARWNGATWDPLGSGDGLDADVLAFATAGGDPLYAGGDFTTAGAVRANRVAAWNDLAGNWSPLGLGFDARVRALELVGPVLHAGGEFSRSGVNPLAHVARFDGANWQPLGSGTDGPVHALKEFGGVLYAGGRFAQAGGVAAGNIAVWNGVAWTALAGGTDDTVRALEVFAEAGTPELYIGGDFLSAGGATANGVVRWNGAAFVPLGGGLCCGGVYDLAVFDDGGGPRLYAAGEFEITGDERIDGVARWHTPTQTWQAIGTGFALGTPTRVTALASWTGGGPPRLAVGGNFGAASGVSARNIVLWDGATWMPLGAGMDAPVHVLRARTVTGGTALFVGGAFTQADLRPSARFARTN